MTANGSTAMCGDLGLGEVPGDAAEQQGIGEAVDRRVEERTALAGGVRRLGQCAVEQVGQRRQDHEHEAQRSSPTPIATAAPPGDEAQRP